MNTPFPPDNGVSFAAGPGGRGRVVVVGADVVVLPFRPLARDCGRALLLEHDAANSATQAMIVADRHHRHDIALPQSTARSSTSCGRLAAAT